MWIWKWEYEELQKTQALAVEYKDQIVRQMQAYQEIFKQLEELRRVKEIIFGTYFFAENWPSLSDAIRKQPWAIYRTDKTIKDSNGYVFSCATAEDAIRLLKHLDATMQRIIDRKESISNEQTS